MASPLQEVRNLSGGNQQKVVLGKWLFANCKSIFLMSQHGALTLMLNLNFIKSLPVWQNKAKPF